MDKRIIQRAEPYLKNLKFTGRVLGRSMKKAAGLCAQGAENIIKDTITRAAGNEQSDSGDNSGSMTGDGRKNYAVITGASSGIGLEFARRLSLEGYPLILIARRRDRLEALRRELGTECLLLPADLARREDLIRLCEDLVGRRIDVFINNAGFGVSGPFMASEVSREVGMIDVNVTAQHVLFKYILHRMEAEGGGSILNVAWVWRRNCARQNPRSTWDASAPAPSTRNSMTSPMSPLLCRASPRRSVSTMPSE